MFCHHKLSAVLFFFISLALPAQILPRIQPAGNAPVQPPKTPGQVRTARINAPGPNDLLIRAATQRVEGHIYFLRGSVAIETAEMLLRADEVDYNEETHYAEARGHVKYTSYERGEELEADRAEYQMNEETGKFYNVRGISPAKVEYRPGLLMSENAFQFQGAWLERLKDRYILYDGFVTNCRLPKPWWVLRGPKFDIIPHQRALAYRPWFRVRQVPLFYFPVFYKALSEEPRKSGFLTPNIGNSSRRGKMVGVGYYWAMNRSYDMTYRTQLFTQRGFAHHVDFRGKPTQNSDFDTIFYGVNDKGLKLDNGDRIKQGGFLLTVHGKSRLPWEFEGRIELNYLSSFKFRQAFTESFNEAVFSEVRSIGFATRHWSTYSLAIFFDRLQNFQSTNDGDQITIRKLPAVSFQSRDRQIFRNLPVWVSMDSSAALAQRTQPLFQSRQFVDRLDAAPRIMAALRWKDFHLLPAFSVRGTHYGSSQSNGQISGQGVFRATHEVSLDLIAPSLSRIYQAPRWLGEKMKHVVEARGGFRDVGGVKDFTEFIRFDDLELMTNTREFDYSLTNRLLVKKGGSVNEVLSWQLWQKRYLNHDLGGAVSDQYRNVFQTQTRMTAYAFFGGPRTYSPVISVLRASPRPNISAEWRSDYDPVLARVTNSSLLGSFRHEKYFISAGHNQVRSLAQLSPNANQFLGVLGWGNSNQRGWSVGFQSVYDFRLGTMQFATTQASFNSDCCGISFQYRRFSFGTRNENQFRVAFAIANIGSFGTLRTQERVF